MINKLIIHKFRCFENMEFEFSKTLTAIAGQNGTGKSTLLALLGHCCEYKVMNGKTLQGKQFRTEFSEIIKASSKFDIVDESIKQFAEIHFDNIPEIKEGKVTYRITWQKMNKSDDDKTRFRIIPTSTKLNGKKSEAKIEIPSLYLGLSRLYPIGESDELPIQNQFNLTSEEQTWLLEQYSHILSQNIILNESKIDSLKISDVKRKNGIGITTSEYDSICNSAGQDNIGQILLALISYDRLKKANSQNWKGGLLLIDELDATLHPVAQIRLLNLLYEKSVELQIQIMFTTHSLTLLEYMYHNYISPKSGTIIYLSNANNKLDYTHNPSITNISTDLRQINILDMGSRKITVYTEDNEARWFLNKLLTNLSGFYSLPLLSVSCSNLIGFLKADIVNQIDKLFILDGDLFSDENIRLFKDRDDIRDKQEVITEVMSTHKNLMILPGDECPENVFWQYANMLCSKNDEESTYLNQYGINLRTLNDVGPFSDKYKESKENRVKLKRWFNDNIELINIVYTLWAKNNKDTISKFRRQFVGKYNNIAKKNLLLEIPDALINE